MTTPIKFSLIALSPLENLCKEALWFPQKDLEIIQRLRYPLLVYEHFLTFKLQSCNRLFISVLDNVS
ncbi:MAG: hypothetical protein ACJAVI_002508 [Candidatus Azotimanducaceae bacterium]|jgi:hypothetical protein